MTSSTILADFKAVAFHLDDKTISSRKVSTLKQTLGYYSFVKTKAILFSVQDCLVPSKYEGICLFAIRILEKRIRIFEYDIFWKSVFVLFYEIVFKRKYDKICLQKRISLLDFCL